MIRKFNTKPKLFEVKDVNRVVIEIYFAHKYKKNKALESTLTKRMVLNGNNEYPNITQFKKKKSELLIINYEVKSYIINDYEIFIFSLVLPSDGLIKEFDLDKAMKFFYDSIFNPATENNEFNNEIFDFEKNYLISLEKDYPSSINVFASDKFLDFYDEKKKNFTHYEDYIKQLKKINSKKAYKYYLKNIKNNDYFSIIYGNLRNKDKLLKSFNKYFKQEYKKLTYDINFYNYLPIVKYKEKTINTKYNQSVLNLYYQVKNMKEDDIILFKFLNQIILSNKVDLIYHNLRNVNNLIYDERGFYSTNYATIILRIFFNIEDLDKIIKIVSDSFDEIRDINKFNYFKKNIIKSLTYDLYDEEDNAFNEVNRYINKNMLNNILLKDFIKGIKKISYNDMLKFLDRIKLTRKMVMIAGDNDDKN